MRTAQAHSPTKEKLLEAAQQLMLVKGFPATTVEEICETAGFTKGSFFHYFESKEHLGKEVLDRFYLSVVQPMLQQGSFRKKSDPLQRLYGYLDRFIELSKNPDIPSGCLLGNFAQELSDTHPEIRSLCAQCFADWAATLKHDLDEVKAKYAPKASFDTQSLAEYLIVVLQGSQILAKAKQDKGVLEQNLQHFKRYIKSLFEK
jgi:TetR/AcrR family transcriptional regulator, transcriptional repressor for nem operon